MKKSTKHMKAWGEKLADSKDLPKKLKLEGKLSKRWGRGTMVIPAPRDVDSAMKRVRRGKLTTVSDICRTLATQYRTTMACPVTTGIFAWISAHAAQEAEAAGRKRVTPYWRTLKAGGELNPKYPGGIKSVRARLEAEGHKFIAKGKRYFVAEFDGPI